MGFSTPSARGPVAPYERNIFRGGGGLDQTPTIESGMGDRWFLSCPPPPTTTPSCFRTAKVPPPHNLMPLHLFQGCIRSPGRPPGEGGRRGLVLRPLFHLLPPPPPQPPTGSPLFSAYSVPNRACQTSAASSKPTPPPPQQHSATR